MVNQADEPLQRITLNLFESDVEWLKRTCGSGYTTMIREMVRQAIYMRKYHLGEEK